MWSQLCELYSEPHRYYHNLNHIAYSLGQLDCVGHLVEEADAIELALWFHDAVYGNGRKDNEERSAELFVQRADGRMDARLVGRVEELILATTHRGPADDMGGRYIVDIDLAGFGLHWEAFLANSEAIRREQGATPKEEIAFLDSLDQRERIFQSDFFYDRMEPTARENIKKYRDVCLKLL